MYAWFATLWIPKVIKNSIKIGSINYREQNINYCNVIYRKKQRHKQKKIYTYYNFSKGQEISEGNCDFLNSSQFFPDFCPKGQKWVEKINKSTLLWSIDPN